MFASDVNWFPSRPELRKFALASIAGFGVLGLVLAWRVGTLSGEATWHIPLTTWVVGVVVAAVGYVVPRAIWPLYAVLTLIGIPIRWTVTILMMLVMFYGVFTPLALLFRLLGRDALCRSIDRDATSYWVRRPSSPPMPRYFRRY